MKITIITGPFGYIPPNGIGAIEKLWFYIAENIAINNRDVNIIAKKKDKKHEEIEQLHIEYVAGFNRTKNIYFDIFLDLIYSLRSIKKVKDTDILLVNTFWLPVVAPLFFRSKYKKLIFNVARSPKRHFLLYKNVDYFCCTSSSTQKELIKIDSKYKQNSCVIPNPIQTQFFNNQPDKDSRDEFIISYHGRIHPEKGLEILVKAINIISSQIGNIKLQLIGPVDIRQGGGGDDFINALKKTAQFELIVHLATSSPERLVQLLRQSNIYCYPSIAEKGESFGVSVVEALGLGLPVIVSDLLCFKDYLEESVNGVIFDHRAKDAPKLLAEKIMFLHDNTDFATKISQKGLETSQKYSVENIAKLYKKCFEEILNNEK